MIQAYPIFVDKIKIICSMQFSYIGILLCF